MVNRSTCKSRICNHKQKEIYNRHCEISILIDFNLFLYIYDVTTYFILHFFFFFLEKLFYSDSCKIVM